MVAREARKALKPEDFGRFLRWLSTSDALAVQEYQVIRSKLIRYFVHKGRGDADELFDRVVDIVVGKIETCETCPSPLAYCYGVARNVWRAALREHEPDSLDKDIPAPQNFEDRMVEQKFTCLDRCLGQLSPAERDAVMGYYRDRGHSKIEIRKQLAIGLGGANALRVRMCRTRKQLHFCIVECLKRSAN
jgi:DNA-directed RNA polymerase specialized sigma24 family protein